MVVVVVEEEEKYPSITILQSTTYLSIHLSIYLSIHLSISLHSTREPTHPRMGLI